MAAEMIAHPLVPAAAGIAWRRRGSALPGIMRACAGGVNSDGWRQGRGRRQSAQVARGDAAGVQGVAGERVSEHRLGVSGAVAKLERTLDLAVRPAVDKEVDHYRQQRPRARAAASQGGAGGLGPGDVAAIPRKWQKMAENCNFLDFRWSGSFVEKQWRFGICLKM